MIYFVKTASGLQVFYSEVEMKTAGYKKPDKTISDEDYSRNGCYAKVVGGEIIIGKTDAEKAEEKRLERISGLKDRLDQIDKEAGCGRASRAIAIETARIMHITHPDSPIFDPAESRDLKRIIDAENAAILIREELAQAVTDE